MEKRDFVDQRRQRVEHFVDQWRSLLQRRGAIVASYRQRGQRRLGPYFRLVCRDSQGRQHSVYLGAASALVDDVSAQLRELQAPRHTRLVIALARRRLKRHLKNELRTLDSALQPLGLRTKGFEIRGWRGANVRPLLPASQESPPCE